MRRTVCLLILASLSFGCAASRPDGSPGEPLVQYDAVSRLMRRETSIKVAGDSLYLHHKSPQTKETIDGTYALESGEVRDLYAVLQEVDFHELQMPKPERLLDAPEVSITAAYDGKKTRIAFGGVKELPQPLRQCRRLLFELAAKYDARMKGILGF